MRQVAILPSGTQIFKRVSVLHYGNDRILYAASLAVYILDAETYRILHVLSMNQRALTSIAVSPLDSDLLVVTARDGCVTLWQIPEERNLHQITLPGSVIAQWNPQSRSQIAILSEESVKLYIWLESLYVRI
jgi:WD40 repeat protein